MVRSASVVQRGGDESLSGVDGGEKRPDWIEAMISDCIRTICHVATLFLVVSWTRSCWHSRRRVEELAGGLLLKVVRPSLKRLELAGVVLFTIFVAASLAALVHIAKSDGLRLSSREVLTEGGILMYLCIWLNIYWCFRRTFLQFRERGLVCGIGFWPWESVRQWGWTDSDRVIRLKLPGLINSYSVAKQDKDAIQAILDKHLGPAKHHSEKSENAERSLA